MSLELEFVTVESPQPARACVIWLHGLGADGYDFAPIVPQLNLSQEDVRFIFPHAPKMPVTLNFGMVMPAWFDLKNVDRRHGVDIPGLTKSSLAVQALIAQQIEQGIPANKIAILGFSQGGAVALYVGLLYPQRLAGIGALSTYLPDSQAHEVKPHTANQNTPIYYCHGTQDGVIPIDYAKASVKDLKQWGCSVEWHEYNMAHSVCPEEIKDISSWLKTVLA